MPQRDASEFSFLFALVISDGAVLCRERSSQRRQFHRYPCTVLDKELGQIHTLLHVPPAYQQFPPSHTLIHAGTLDMKNIDMFLT